MLSVHFFENRNLKLKNQYETESSNSSVKTLLFSFLWLYFYVNPVAYSLCKGHVIVFFSQVILTFILVAKLKRELNISALHNRAKKAKETLPDEGNGRVEVSDIDYVVIENLGGKTLVSECSVKCILYLSKDVDKLLIILTKRLELGGWRDTLFN